MQVLSRLFPPPARLRAISERRSRTLRLLWLLLFSFALIVVVLATMFTVRASYEYQPAFAALGLDTDVADGRVLVGLPEANGQAAIGRRGSLVAIDGRPVDADSSIGELARQLNAAPGPVVSIVLAKPGGERVQLEQRRRPAWSSAEESRARDLRVLTRLGFALLACAVLLLCSSLLALRQPEDPVAMLFAITFSLMAASIDPPVQMWLWTGHGWVEDVLGGAWFYLLLIGLAVFPTGLFVPRFLRWIIYGAIPLVVFASLPNIDGTLQVVVAIAALLALLGSHVVRYRRLPPGIERQQLKWAAFGFAAGFVLLLVAFLMVAAIPDDPSQQNALFNLVTLVFFSLGMAAIPFGLLVALTRFRLWEADTVITRSAAYAVVTLLVGVIWAASADLVKLVVSEVVGRESEAGATAVSAMIAAGIFAPTQSAVLGWTKRKFSGPLDQVRSSAERLKKWGLTETPEELATRALEIVELAMHPSAAAIMLDLPGGAAMIAARGVPSAADPRLVDRLLLEDDEGPVGRLLLGRRSDGNRYNKQELKAVRELIPNLAEALRLARSRHSRESVLQQQLAAMAARLAQLEGGPPKPA